MKKILAAFLILISTTEIAGKISVPVLSDKNSLFKTNQKILPFEIELMREVQLNDYKKPFNGVVTTPNRVEMQGFSIGFKPLRQGRI
jgi:hypothetical protein